MPRFDANDRLATDAEGFLLDAAAWTPDTAERVARRLLLDPLSDMHWKVITQCREWYARKGSPPGLERISTLTGLGVEELHSMFGDDPVRPISLLAGLPNPRQPAPTDSA